MKLYHGTTEGAWKEIQAEGVLWGRTYEFWEGERMCRITWLAIKREHAEIFGNFAVRHNLCHQPVGNFENVFDAAKNMSWWLVNKPCVILEVDMPEIKGVEKDVWQIAVCDPIPLARIKRIQ